MARLGNYRIVRQIGEGGFARTYEAEHVLLGTKACIKQNINVSDLDTEVFRQEAALLWDINHHSLPAMKDFFEVGDGSHALVMTYVEGKTLDKIVEERKEQGKAIHPEDVCWIMQRLFQALHYLHSYGIVHSDVKPQNVIVQPEMHNAVLVDYGLSVFRPKRDSMPMGYTAAYAAPELLEGKPPIPESDLYGAGLVMLYALGGDIMAKTYPKHVPEPIKEFCDELLRYDPMERPNWEKEDLVKKLSDVRQEVFGRRHSGRTSLS